MCKVLVGYFPDDFDEAFEGLGLGFVDILVGFAKLRLVREDFAAGPIGVDGARGIGREIVGGPFEGSVRGTFAPVVALFGVLTENPRDCIPEDSMGSSSTGETRLFSALSL